MVSGAHLIEGTVVSDYSLPGSAAIPFDGRESAAIDRPGGGHSDCPDTPTDSALDRREPGW